VDPSATGHKAGGEHHVPLSPRVVAILRKFERARESEFVFPRQALNEPLSNMVMEMVLRRMKIEGATVHGFRSSFRDWAGNVSSFPREVVETALAPLRHGQDIASRGVQETLCRKGKLP
jgi:integrase